MLYIVIWLVKRIVEKFPSRYRAAILCQHTNLTFYSSFEENCQQIKLTAEEISPLKKINTENKMSPENYSRRTPAPKELPPRNKATLHEI